MPAETRYAVTATNHNTGETWSIHDTQAACKAELARILKAWGKDATVTVDGPVEIVDGVERVRGVRALTESEDT